MQIETRFDLGDKVYYVYEDEGRERLCGLSPDRAGVYEVTVKWEVSEFYVNDIDVDIVRGKLSIGYTNHHDDYHESADEDDCFATEEEAIRAADLRNKAVTDYAKVKLES